MDIRIVGTEIEYGCLIESDLRAEEVSPEAIAVLVKNALFLDRQVGILDLHYRDWGEPPGNGGFLFNGGRLYIDMGHLEYATPECLSFRDIIAYEQAADRLLLEGLEVLGCRDDVSFVRNNVDHATGATFGYHENYLVSTALHFYQEIIPFLMPFLVTRQIFTGAGRVGYHDEVFFDEERHLPRRSATLVTEEVPYQISQRADHIVTEAYQWVQFSRAIINTRNEPLADPSRFRRIHLLLGDSNMSEYATALKIGTTAIVITLAEERIPMPPVSIADPVFALREISRDNTYRWEVLLETGRFTTAIEIQGAYLALAERYLDGYSQEIDWVLREWRATLEALADDPMSLNDRLDWVAKRWLLETFIEEEGISWSDPWLQSIDLEYHKIDPEKGLYHDLVAEGMMRRVVPDWAIDAATESPPPDTRAHGRARIMRQLHEVSSDRGPVDCIVEWDGIYMEYNRSIPMPDPFRTYESEAERLPEYLAQAPPPDPPPARARKRRRSRRSE